MEYLELQNTQTPPSDSLEYGSAQMPALTHSSSCLNSTIYSLLHTLFSELSLCSLVYIMKRITSQIYLKKKILLLRYILSSLCLFLPFACPIFFLSGDSVGESTLKGLIKWLSRTQPSESIL